MLPIRAGNLPRLRAVRPEKGSWKVRRLLRTEHPFKANRRQSLRKGEPKILQLSQKDVNRLFRRLLCQVALTTTRLRNCFFGSKKGQIWAPFPSQSDLSTLGYFRAELVASKKYMVFDFRLKGQLVLFQKIFFGRSNSPKTASISAHLQEPNQGRSNGMRQIITLLEDQL